MALLLASIVELKDDNRKVLNGMQATPLALKIVHVEFGVSWSGIREKVNWLRRHPRILAVNGRLCLVSRKGIRGILENRQSERRLAILRANQEGAMLCIDGHGKGDFSFAILENLMPSQFSVLDQHAIEKFIRWVSRKEHSVRGAEATEIFQPSDAFNIE